MRREGSALNGIGVVTLKELDDNLTSVRMRVLEVLIVLFAIVAVYLAIQQVRETTAEDPFLLLRLFTRAREGIPITFVAFLSILVPVMAIGLGFRCRQQRIQPANALANPGAADLSRRAAVRKIHCRIAHDYVQPGGAVAARDRVWA